MDITRELLHAADVTKGRIGSSVCFNDFLAYCALTLSNNSDPAHLEERKQQKEYLLKTYREPELQIFDQTLQLLAEEIVHNTNRGAYTDILGPVYTQFHPRSGPLKQDFSPPSVGMLLNRIAFQNKELPEKGYFTLTDPTCGSGSLCLAGAEKLLCEGFNPCEQLVVFASDLAIPCVHMTYLQLSLYGIPAVIVRGDTITLTEYDRWYTPMYLLRNWVWREPLSFVTGRNADDESLKMMTEPWYARARYLGHLMKCNSAEEMKKTNE